LDGLRGIAVLLIYTFHYGGGLTSHNPIVRFFGTLTSSGWIGVPLFFALSGFLITNILWESQQHPRPPHRLRNFYARRILRIFPLYFAALAMAAVIMLALGADFQYLRALLNEVFFLQDIPHFADATDLRTKLPLFHLWSVAVEEQFYLLWPFLLLLCRTRRAALHLCLSIFAISLGFCLFLFGATHLVSDNTAQAFNHFLLVHAGALALGAFVAIALQEPDSPERSMVIRHAPAAFLIGLALFVSSSLYLHTFNLVPRMQFFTGLPGIWIASAAIIPLILYPGNAASHFTRRIFAVAPLRFLGRISYGFYVFHLLLQPLFDHIGRSLAHTNSGYAYQSARFVTAFPITLAVAWVSFQLFELPFLQLKRHFPTRPALPAT
jgi:peptidoglycan/LPS O-acetylase OafA/YrhL